MVQEITALVAVVELTTTLLMVKVEDETVGTGAAVAVGYMADIVGVGLVVGNSEPVDDGGVTG